VLRWFIDMPALAFIDAFSRPAPAPDFFHPA
jgi:hypothetical protein